MYGKKRNRLESRSRTQGSCDWDELIKETYGEDAVTKSKDNEVVGSNMKRSQSSPATLSSPRKKAAASEKKKKPTLENNGSTKKKPRSQTPSSGKRRKTKGEAKAAGSVFDMMMGANRRKSQGLPANGESSNLKKKTSKGRKSIENKNTLEQVYMDVGQQGLGSTKCSVCGMLYYTGQAADEKMHKSFHNKFTEGVNFPGWKRETLVRRFTCDEQHDEGKGGKTPAGRVIVVDDSVSTQQKKKVGEILEMVDRELGGVRQKTEEGSLISRDEKVYIYINEKKRVCGCVVVHRINRAFSIDDYDHHNEMVTSAKASRRKAKPENEGEGGVEEELGCEASTQRILAFDAASSPSSQRQEGKEGKGDLESGARKLDIKHEEPDEVDEKCKETAIMREAPSSLDILPAPMTMTTKTASAADALSPPVAAKSEQKAETPSNAAKSKSKAAQLCTPSTRITSDGNAVSKTPKRAVIGVDKIWVHRKFRRSGIATRMLESIRNSFVYGYVVPREEVAFSQPTEMGAGLAIAYTQDSGFLSYK